MTGDPDRLAFEVLGGPEAGPTLRLDHERFAYAGKFVMSATGKAVLREAGTLLAAAAFDRDRTDPDVARIRYVTVRSDRRGEGLGPRLLAALADYLATGTPGGAGAERVLIAVNNGYAYEAAYRVGFGYTGERTGLAELVLSRPGDRSAGTYRRGLARLLEREDLGEEEADFIEARVDGEPPSPVDPATGA